MSALPTAPQAVQEIRRAESGPAISFAALDLQRPATRRASRAQPARAAHRDAGHAGSAGTRRHPHRTRPESDPRSRLDGRGPAHRVLMNLTANAGDAMPDGGTLTLATANRPAPAGGVQAVHLTVTDTGIGMPPEVQARVFEPFFTTKARPRHRTRPGHRARHRDAAGGEVLVRSAPGQGTCFEERLPPVDGPRRRRAAPARRRPPSRATSSWWPRTRRRASTGRRHPVAIRIRGDQGREQQARARPLPTTRVRSRSCWRTS